MAPPLLLPQTPHLFVLEGELVQVGLKKLHTFSLRAEQTNHIALLAIGCRSAILQWKDHQLVKLHNNVTHSPEPLQAAMV